LYQILPDFAIDVVFILQEFCADAQLVMELHIMLKGRIVSQHHLWFSQTPIRLINWELPFPERSKNSPNTMPGAMWTQCLNKDPYCGRQNSLISWNQ